VSSTAFGFTLLLLLLVVASILLVVAVFVAVVGDGVALLVLLATGSRSLFLLVCNDGDFLLAVVAAAAVVDVAIFVVFLRLLSPSVLSCCLTFSLLLLDVVVGVPLVAGDLLALRGCASFLVYK